VMSLDQAEATFKRRPEKLDTQLLQKLAGQYQTAAGFKFQVLLRDDGRLVYAFPGSPEETLVPYKGLKFRAQEFSDVIYEFVLENGDVKSMRRRNAAGEYTNTRTDR